MLYNRKDATCLPGLPATLYKLYVTMYCCLVHKYIYYYHLVVSLPYHPFSQEQNKSFLPSKKVKKITSIKYENSLKIIDTSFIKGSFIKGGFLAKYY